MLGVRLVRECVCAVWRGMYCTRCEVGEGVCVLGVRLVRECVCAWCEVGEGVCMCSVEGDVLY